MKLIAEASPHLRSQNNTSRVMLDVIIALIPTLVAGVIVHGLRALTVTAVAVVACVLSEGLYRLITRQHNTLPDLSAVVTGMLLAMTLPASVPYWAAAAGGAFAMIVCKGISGGLGRNAFNPALSGRAFLMLIVPAALTRFAAPGAALPLAGTVDIVSAATPLHHMQMPALPNVSLTDAFLGRIGGCIGETSTLALLLGFAWLLIRRVTNVRIPLAYLGSVAVLTLIFSKGDNALLWMSYNLLCGGVMLGALFMATDYATSPVTPMGQWIFGLGCGVLTVLLRYKGLFPEGVTYAILLMNPLARLLDRWTMPRRFGRKGGARA